MPQRTQLRRLHACLEQRASEPLCAFVTSVRADPAPSLEWTGLRAQPCLHDAWKSWAQASKAASALSAAEGGLTECKRSGPAGLTLLRSVEHIICTCPDSWVALQLTCTRTWPLQTVHRPAQVYALTFVHSAFTMVGMWLFAAAGMFEVKRLAARQARLWPRPGPCRRHLDVGCPPALAHSQASFVRRGCLEFPIALPAQPSSTVGCTCVAALDLFGEFCLAGAGSNSRYALLCLS